MSKRNDWPKDEEAPWLVDPGSAPAPPQPLAALPSGKKGTRAPESDIPAPCRACRSDGGYWVPGATSGVQRCTCARGEWLLAKDRERAKHPPIIGEI